ncbi:MAG: glycoside hydrolase N-terminal domain-containing protein [Clostridia bacterium]|nr:glycoside hydrolase N-terminal domain-containing protein [Clostridia bacterium]
MEKKLINAYPAQTWKEASPVGNGTLGALVYGCVYDERILINHEALYNWTCNKEIPDISFALKDVRNLMDQKKYKDAEVYYTNALKERGYFANKGKFFPAFDLHFIFETNGAFENYSRSIDMENGICTVSYNENNSLVTRQIFSSQNDRYVVINIKKNEKFSLTASLEKHDMVDYPNEPCNDKFSSFAKDSYIYSESKTDGGLHFSGIVKILNTDGKISTKDKDRALNIDMVGNASLKNYIKIEDATDVTFLLDVSKSFMEFDDMKAQIDKCTLTFDELKERQIKAFSALFNSTRLTITNDTNKSNEALLLDSYNGKVDLRLFEKMADFGRYLLISSSYGCEFPANLQGLWNGDYSPAWACTFFNNENIQMNYWQAYAGGLSEAVLPLFNLYDKFKDDYRENAKKLFGCRGILLPLFMDNSNGKKDNLQPHVLYWTGSSAWISAIYYDYFLYTQDLDFLANRAYPFMKEACLFYEDFMVRDENGKLKSYPSDSPENRPDGNFEGAKEISVCINPTMDFALLKELLTNLLTASKKLGLDNELRTKWEGMLKAIPEYQINEDGAICEWMHEDFKDNYHHRHQSHIYPLFPGFEINEAENKKLFDAMKIAVEKRLCIGLKEQTGWSFAHMANIFARLGNSEKAKECLELLIRFCTGDNLFTHHNDWRNMGVTLKYMHMGHAPFQIDANMGFVSAVYEMLMYSDNDKIKLLPACPDIWREGSVENIHARGGFVLTISWNEGSVSAKIHSLFKKQINIGISNGFKLRTIDARISKSKYGNDYHLISLNENESITLTYSK